MLQRSLLKNRYLSVTIISRISVPEISRFLSQERKRWLQEMAGKSPSQVQLIILGNGHRGSPKSLAVRTDQSTYLFNCGEGTQKSLTEFSGGVARIENIFFTGQTWDHVGGSVGLFLTLRDAKINKSDTGKKISSRQTSAPECLPEKSNRLTFHGPVKTGKLVSFYKSCEMDGEALAADKIYFAQSDPSMEKWSDDLVQVRYVPLTVSDGGAEDTPDAEAFSFVLDPFPSKPRLDMFKAMQLKIPRGPLLGKLVNGESVTLEDGRIVHPEEVTIPPVPTGSLAVVDCPRIDLLPSLMRHPVWNRLKSPAVLVHLSPDDVLADENYVTWSNSLDTAGAHFLVTPKAGGIPSVAAYRHQFKLSRVNARLFPLLPDQVRPSSGPFGRNPFSIRKSILCQPGFQMTIRPAEDAGVLTGEPRNLKRIYDEKAFSEEIDKESPQLESLVAKCNAEIDRLNIDPTKDQFPQLVFLGTSSALPLSERNVSGILLRLCPDISGILDAGEGTAAQLKRRYGDEADDVFRTIRFVFLSHNHTDHHLGLTSIIEASRRAHRATPNAPKNQQIFVVLPARMSKLIQHFNDDLAPILDVVKTVLCQDLFVGKEPNELHKEFMDAAQLKEITSCYVQHCSQACGISMVHQDGWKLTYSGDTKPSEELVAIGHDSDVLIHEATMCDGLLVEAEKKRHSTVSQALEIGKKMNAKCVILTHFSGRFAKCPVLPDDTTLLKNVGVAYDFGFYSFLRDHNIFSLVIKPLQSLFCKALQDSEHRTMQRLYMLEDQIFEKRQEAKRKSEDSESLIDVPQKVPKKMINKNKDKNKQSLKQ